MCFGKTAERKLCYDTFGCAYCGHLITKKYPEAVDATLCCGQMFHHPCLEKWLHMYESCPQCDKKYNEGCTVPLAFHFVLESVSDKETPRKTETKKKKRSKSSVICTLGCSICEKRLRKNKPPFQPIHAARCCGHLFHRECLWESLKTSEVCPKCCSKISKDDTVHVALGRKNPVVYENDNFGKKMFRFLTDWENICNIIIVILCLLFAIYVKPPFIFTPTPPAPPPPPVCKGWCQTAAKAVQISNGLREIWYTLLDEIFRELGIAIAIVLRIVRIMLEVFGEFFSIIFML